MVNQVLQDLVENLARKVLQEETEELDHKALWVLPVLEVLAEKKEKWVFKEHLVPWVQQV